MSSKTKQKRPLPKKERSKYSPADKKKILSLAAVFFVVLLAAVWLLIAYGRAINTIDPMRSGVIGSPLNAGIEDFEYISVPTEEGRSLEGWYLPASGDGEVMGDKVIIISHNYESSRESTENDGVFFYKHLLDNGYDVVAFDYSGSGESAGKYYTFGAEEKDELLEVVDFVHQMNPDAEITLFGWAFGGAAAITAGCESPYVSAVIADSSYTDLDGYLKTSLNIWTGLPSWLFDSTVKSMMEGLSGCDFSSSSPISAIAKTEGKRFFFIHAKDDTVIPTTASEALYQEAIKNNSAEIWIIEGVPHICGFAMQEDNYVNRVLNFLNSSVED